MHDPDAMKVFPYVRYHGRNDGRTRSEHGHLDGKIFHKGDPFLSTHTPPWEFNCRCWLEEISEKEAGKTPDLIQPPTPADKVTVDSKSGFVFDPAHAFEKFDLTSIKDDALRKDAAGQLVNRFGMSVSPDGKYASVSTDTKKIEMPPTEPGEKVNNAISGLKKSRHIETVNFSGMPEKAAENTGKAAAWITQRVEEYGLDISYVGTRFNAELGKKYLESKTVLETREENGRTEFIFNEKLLADEVRNGKLNDPLSGHTACIYTNDEKIPAPVDIRALETEIAKIDAAARKAAENLPAKPVNKKKAGKNKRPAARRK